MTAPFALLVWIALQSPQAPPPRDIPVPAASDKEFFFSWGYNGDSYTRQDMFFKQPALGNDFTLYGVQAHDSKAWTDLFSHSLFVPQYNIRFGYFFNSKWGLEMALDHIKWIVTQDQQVRITGTLNHQPADGQIVLSEAVLKYQLNNGANPIFFNLLRRVRLAGTPGKTWSTSLLAKAGAGFAVPHTENTVFGVNNVKGFQFFHGWNMDFGAAVRTNLYKRIYFEFEDKFVYASYHGVNIDQGTAHHSLKANQFIWSFGIAFR